MLAHIVTTYDVKLEDGATRPRSLHFGTSIMPNPRAKSCSEGGLTERFSLCSRYVFGLPLFFLHRLESLSLFLQDEEHCTVFKRSIQPALL